MCKQESWAMARNNRVESKVQSEGGGYQGMARLAPMGSQHRGARRVCLT